MQKETGGSLARVHGYVKKLRKKYKNNLILLENGDILQGQPSAYYYNYIDTTSVNLTAEILNYMKFDVGNVGNHDVETGRTVLEKWINECNFPILGANIIETSTGKTFLPPYVVFEREGIKIAVLGMITPAIPVWLPESLWQGLHFEDMEATARKWMPVIREKENPDIVIGLFHAGKKEALLGGKYKDNASLTVARNIPGFDLIMIGHDHTLECKKVANIVGDSVLVINPASDGRYIGEVDITVKLSNGKVVDKQIKGRLTNVCKEKPDKQYMKHFSGQYKKIENFVTRRIGYLTESISSRECYFGPSSFVDLIHTLQLKITGADVSFVAPLAFDTKIEKGNIYVKDMFNLYKYENTLYTVWMTGNEIKGFLEESYNLWTNQMSSSNDHILKLKQRTERNKGFNPLMNFSFNFDSAAGIIYTVDVTKEKGEKINIISMADGTPFSFNKKYMVVLNSYRGNGGGELMTKGAGIPQEELKSRILSTTDRDFRRYLIKYIQEKDTLVPRPLNHWKFIPEEWANRAIEKDYKILFPYN